LAFARRRGLANSLRSASWPAVAGSFSADLPHARGTWARTMIGFAEELHQFSAGAGVGREPREERIECWTSQSAGARRCRRPSSFHDVSRTCAPAGGRKNRRHLPGPGLGGLGVIGPAAQMVRVGGLPRRGPNADGRKTGEGGDPGRRAMLSREPPEQGCAAQRILGDIAGRAVRKRLGARRQPT